MSYECRATRRTVLWHGHWTAHALVSQVLAHKGNLRDDLAPFLYRYQVSLVEIQIADEILVIERRTGDGGPGELYWLQLCHRRDNAAPPGLVADFQKSCDRFLGIVLVGDCPLGALRRHADPLMERVVIDFQHHPIRRHLQFMPVEIPVVEILVYLLYRVTEGAVRAYR